MPPDIDAADALAIAALERYQEKHYDRIGLVRPTPDQSGRDDPSKSSLFIPGSKYDSPLFRSSLTQMALELQEWLTCKPNKPPIMGGLPFAYPRAMYAQHKASGRAIFIFNQGQFEFFNRAMSALVHACPIRKQFSKCSVEELSYSESWQDTKRYDEALPAFMYAMLGAALDMRVPSKRIVESLFGAGRADLPLDDVELEMSMRLQDCLTAFVIGHEYGHTVEDEVFQAFTCVANPFGNLTEEKTAEFIENVKSECVADDIGIGLAHRRNGAAGLGPEESYLGIMLFFFLTLFLDDFIKLFRDGSLQHRLEVDTFTHPPLFYRIEKAKEAFKEHDKIESHLARGEALAMSFWGVLSNLCLRLSPYVRLWRERELYKYLAPELRERPPNFED